MLVTLVFRINLVVVVLLRTCAVAIQAGSDNSWSSGSPWEKCITEEQDETTLLQMPGSQHTSKLAGGGGLASVSQNLQVEDRTRHAMMLIANAVHSLARNATQGTWLPNIPFTGIFDEAARRMTHALGAFSSRDEASPIDDALRNTSAKDLGSNAEFWEPMWEIERKLALAAQALRTIGGHDISEEVRTVLDALRNIPGIALGNTSLDLVNDTAVGAQLRDNLNISSIVRNASGHPAADIVGVVRNASASLFEDHVPHFLDATGPFISPELAKKHGMLVHVGDFSEATGVRGEEMAKADRSFEGDMVADSDEQLALFQEMSQGKRGPWVAAGKPWTRGHVKYCFASDVVQEVRHRFAAAVQQIERASCITFEDVGWRRGDSTADIVMQQCNERPAIFVMSRPNYGCYSVVGESWMPSQQLQLQHPGCTSQGVILHELGHALGMAHEHSRPDRDQFIKINWDNIQPQWTHAFDVSPDAFVGEPYEYLSLMHYDPYAFSKDHDSLPTIEVAGSHRGDIGQRSGFAEADISQLIKMYEAEVASCSGHAIAGTGCVNMPSDEGEDVCSGLFACGGVAMERCCACGGGVEVQCYEGAECPSTPLLPRGNMRDCVVDMTALFLAHGAASGTSCVVHNQCNKPLQFSCPNAPCTHNIAAGAYQSNFCHDAPADQICSNPDLCEVWEVAEEAVYSLAEPVAQEDPASAVKGSGIGTFVTFLACACAIMIVGFVIHSYLSSIGTLASAPQ